MEDPPASVAHPAFIAGQQLSSSHVLWHKGKHTVCGLCDSWATQRSMNLLAGCVVALEGPHRISPKELQALLRVRKRLPPLQTSRLWDSGQVPVVQL